MTNNDVLRRLRYAFDMSEGEMAASMPVPAPGYSGRPSPKAFS